jgi:restriction system protein
MEYLLLTLFILGLCFLLRRKTRHQRNVASAEKRLKTLQSIDAPARQFSYLRKLDPFVFEELILTAIRNNGGRIKRNKRYTGDGGIDGRATINRVDYLIQAKRYGKHINRQHVATFEELCKKTGKRGLFVHTGRTGAGAQQSTGERVDIVSGQRLLDLLLARDFQPRV